jgi:hypothetical protein
MSRLRGPSQPQNSQMRGRGSAADAEAERKRRLTSVAIDYSVIVQAASVPVVQPMERVTKQLTGQLQRALEGRLELEDTWSALPAQEQVDGDQDNGGLTLFTMAGRREATKVAPLLVAARGVADDAELVTEPQPVAKTLAVERSAWEGVEMDVEEIAAAPAPAVELEHVAERADSEIESADSDADAEDESLVSRRVVASRTRVKRHREPVVAARERNRSDLSALCVTAKDLPTFDTLDCDRVAALLPAPAVVIPHAGEQPPSPDMPGTRYRSPPPSHRRWQFDESGREQAEASVSARQRRRHPGVLRKVRSSVPEVRMVELPVVAPKEEVVAPVAPIRSSEAAAEAVAVARARKSVKRSVPKNLMIAQSSPVVI